MHSTGTMRSEADGIQWEALNVFQLTDPGVGLAAGVGLFLAFWSWVGFEAVPNYAEESRDPKRDMPKGIITAMLVLLLISGENVDGEPSSRVGP